MKITCERTNNTNLTYSSPISFKAVSAKNLEVNTLLSKESVKLIKEVDTLIDTTWTKIKKGTSKLKRPDFEKQYGRTSKISLKPVYNTAHDSFMLEITGEKYINRICVERHNPDIFSYEKAVITKSGSATIKTYDSRREYDPEIIYTVDTYLKNYIPPFLSKDSKINQYIK